MSGQKIQVYAVVRWETFAPEPELAFTVTEVLNSHEEAANEVSRLNRVRVDSRIRYFWQATRYYPTGRSSDSKPAGENETR
jgi:hypothetical protein